MFMYRHIIWDMGGTLVDTYPQVDHVIARVGYGTSQPTSAQLSEVVKLRTTSIDHAMTTLSRVYGADVNEMRREYEALKERWKLNPAPVMGGAKKVMAAVRQAGGLNFIATHRDRKSAESLLAGLGLDIDDMVCAPDGFPRKPDPAMLITLLERHHLDPADVIAVGDRMIDVEAAEAAGCRAILFDHQGGAPGRIKVLSELIPMLSLKE